MAVLLTHTSNRCHLAPLGGARGLRSRRFVKARASVAPETANTGEHLVFYERKDDVDGIAPIDVVTLFGPRLSDRYPAPLPPVFKRPTRLVRYSPDGSLWGMEQPFGLFALQAGIRCTIQRLPSGGLWVCSPVAPTEEALACLGQVGGDVEHIVIPNTSPEHGIFAGKWAELFPSAKVWAPRALEGSLGGLGDSSRLFYLEDKENAQKAWGGIISYEILTLPPDASITFSECTFLLPGGVLLTFDLMFGYWPDLAEEVRLWLDLAEEGSLLNEMTTASGIFKQLSPSPVSSQPIIDAYPALGKAWVESLLGMDFDTAIPGHGSAPIANAKQLFSAGFGPLVR